MSASGLPFTKMSGGGNDFLVLDAADLPGGDDLTAWVRRVCRRGLSVGADGVLVMEPSQSADIRLVHYNADGGRSELCGNGTRCAARWARLRGRGGDPLTVETDAGTIRATFPAEGRVELRLPFRPAPPEARTLRLGDGSDVSGYTIRVGIPHFIVRVDSIADAPVAVAGPQIRHHRAFGEEGTNASFIVPRADGSLDIRTFERGVEEETLACGTGCVAAALVAMRESWCVSPVRCRTRSGIELTVAAGREDGELTLTGDARLVYEGRLGPEGDSWGAPAGAG